MTKQKMTYFASLITSDLLNLEREIKAMEPYVAGFYLELMDFHFVPNLTWGLSFINPIRKITKKQLLIHLLVDYPEKYLDRLDLHEKDIVSMHFESESDWDFNRLSAAVAIRGWTPSAAFLPDTYLHFLNSFEVRHVLLLSAQPALADQKFMPNAIARVEELNVMRNKSQKPFTIAVAGQINEENYTQIFENGADQVVIDVAMLNKLKKTFRPSS